MTAMQPTILAQRFTVEAFMGALRWASGRPALAVDRHFGDQDVLVAFVVGRAIIYSDVRPATEAFGRGHNDKPDLRDRRRAQVSKL